MELRHLRYFVAVAEMENVSRAALKLHVSQPALSKQIRDLEREIGFALLERTAKSVRLTEAGRAFLGEARAILRHASEAVLKGRAVAGKFETELRVGNWALGTGRVMPALLHAYQQAMPNVHVKLHDRTFYQNIAGVRDGRLHLAIVVRPPKANALNDFLFQELKTARLCLAVSSSHPFARRRSVSLTAAAREPFVGLIRERYQQYHEHLASIFARANCKPRIVEEHDGWTGLFSAVGAGTGVTISSDVFGYVFGERVKYVRLTPEPKRAVIGIITRKEKLSPAAEKFCQCAKEAFAGPHK